MTARGGSSEAEREGRSQLGEDLAFLVVAVLLVVLPGWLASRPEGRIRVLESAAPPFRIEVNRAPWYEWTLLEGIGETRARSIVRHREAHGPFRSPEDLAKVPRMPQGWVEKAKEYLVFEE